jgi:hypothetical protein
VLIHDDGTVERVGAAARPSLRVRPDELRPRAATPARAEGPRTGVPRPVAATPARLGAAA